MSLRTAIVAAIAATHTKDTGLAIARDPLDLHNPLYWESGTGANQADQVYDVAGTLSASSALAPDLQGGFLVDAFGDAIAMARVKVLYVENRGTSGNLTVTGTCTAAGSGSTLVRPGGFLLHVAPDATAYVATAGSADTITVTNSTGAGIAYRLIIIGASA
jgi:hypothetical protein